MAKLRKNSGNTFPTLDKNIKIRTSQEIRTSNYFVNKKVLENRKEKKQTITPS